MVQYPGACPCPMQAGSLAILELTPICAIPLAKPQWLPSALRRLSAPSLERG